MSRYQDIYDSMAEGRKLLAEAKKQERIERIEELAIELEAVGYAMDQALFQASWNKLKKVYDRLSNERENLLRKI